MAATASTTATGSYFHTLKKLRPNLPHFPSDHALLHLRISPSRFSSLLSQSSSIEALPLGVGVTAAALQRFRVPRVTAAVAQEEVAVSAEEEVVEKVESAGVEGGDDQVVVTAEEEVVEEVESAGVEGGDDQVVDFNTKLYFGNLPYSVDSAQLAGIIQDHGSPELIEVLYDRDTGRSRGFAFVTMSSVEDCNAVIENLDGSQYMGRIMRVNFADKPKPKEPLYPESEHKLFVGNLSWSVTSESLTQAFQEYGNVVGARVLYDGETGKSRGYGFVCYSTKAEMETALESLNGMELEGRAMRVSLAEGKRS